MLKTREAQLQEILRAADAILEQADLPMRTDELVRRLEEKSFDEYSIRAAIWHLINRNRLRIERTPHHVLLAKA